MDTAFEMQHPFAEEPAWSTLSPELSWSTLLLERRPNDTCQLTNISDKPKVRRDDDDGCHCEREPVPSAKDHVRIKGYTRRQSTKTHSHIPKHHKPWPNPNIAAEPKYAEEANNVFLTLQQRPLRNEHFDPGDEIVIARPLPPPDDLDVQPADSNQLSFFLRGVPQYLGCICCLPQMVNIFMQSINQPIVRHSILALSSVIQQSQGNSANAYIRRNVQQIVPQIQSAIRQVKISDSHMVSVTFLAWLALTSCDFAAAHRHIRGIVSMLKVTNHVQATANPSRKDPNPLAMFLFCLAVKADNYLACRNQPLAIPPIQYNEEYHRQWLQKTTTNEMHLQYSLATIQLDCLANNIAHLHHQATQMRDCGFFNIEQELARLVGPLKSTHKSWVSRPYIQHHITANQYEGDPVDLTSSPNRFLWHPAYIIFDPLVAYMHLNHTYLTIHMNLVLAGRIDPQDYETYEAAILICRIYAALNTAIGENAGRTLNGSLGALWFAGMVFAHPDSNSAKELKWVQETLVDIDQGSRFHAATKMSDALTEFNTTGGDPWEIIGRQFKSRARREGSEGDSSSPKSSTSPKSSSTPPSSNTSIVFEQC